MRRRSIKQPEEENVPYGKLRHLPGMNEVVVSGTEVVVVTGNLCAIGVIRRVVSET